MLRHLLITNFAIVDRLELELQPGMTVITGATGAGKSILLEALGLALGDRADASQPGPLSARAEVHAAFDISTNPDARHWLHERDLLLDEHTNEALLRRVISREGPSRAYLNGRPCALQDLRSFADLVIDVHAQHEHQSLLRRAVQRRLVDEFGRHPALAMKVADLASDLAQRRAGCDTLRRASRDQEARQQLLRYQCEELRGLELAQGEVERLEVEHRRLAGAERHRDGCLTAIALLEDGEPSLTDQLARAGERLRDLDEPLLANVLELLESSRIQLDEAARDLRLHLDRIEEDPERLQAIEARLDAIHQLARKHRTRPEALPDLLVELQGQLDQLATSGETLERLEAEIEALTATYHTKARQLSSARLTSARKLARAVSDKLQALDMRGAAFDVVLQPDTSLIREAGYDEVEFVVTTVAGQEPRPLVKIASGGELSRISLAIQVATAQTSRVHTLVFDEVDVGIGGGTGEVVGRMLRGLGGQGQVICVTHLAQVAAQGHQHLQVTRHEQAGATTTMVRSLEPRERIGELARMMGGQQVSDESIAHAEAMYRSAQSG